MKRWKPFKSLRINLKLIFVHFPHMCGVEFKNMRKEAEMERREDIANRVVKKTN